MKEKGGNSKSAPETPKLPYLSIPNIERPDDNRRSSSSPNSGPKYNPVLERKSSWFDEIPDTIQETEVFSQQDVVVSHEEPGESSSRSEKQ